MVVRDFSQTATTSPGLTWKDGMLTLLAVYGEVAVVNELTSLAAGVCKAHAENYVVQTALELLAAGSHR